jgi:hypothetical protein
MGGEVKDGLLDKTVVKLRGGQLVTVKRWAWTKSLLVMNHFEGIWSQLIAAKLEAPTKDGLKDFKMKLFRILGDSALDFVLFSTDKADEETIRAAAGESGDFEDMLALVSAAVDLNLTESVVKKVAPLVAKLIRLMPGGNE